MIREMVEVYPFIASSKNRFTFRRVRRNPRIRSVTLPNNPKYELVIIRWYKNTNRVACGASR